MNDRRIPWLIGGTVAILVAVFFYLLARQPVEVPVADSTTTSVPSPTSTTTTMPVDTTTTSVPVTTTTVAATTTTTQPWSDVPLVVSVFGALGWWDGATWIEAAPPLPVAGGEAYAVPTLTGVSVIVGGEPGVLCEPLDNPGVPFDDEAPLGLWPGPFTVGVSGGWDLIPHDVAEVADDGTYAGFARELLSIRGLDVDEPVIKRLVRVDLEGDGIAEALVVAEEIGDPGLIAQPGDYSIVFLRKILDEEVQTAILADSIVPADAEPGTPFVLSHDVAAVADLNGDDLMEIVISESYYEGASVGVWEWAGNDLGPVYRIGSGCGA